MSVTPEQMERLPKWASNWIADCERRAKEAEARLKKYLDNQTPSLVYTQSGLYEKRFIQDDRVTFKLKNGEVTVSVYDDTLECHANYTWGRLVVLPRSPNVVQLGIEEGR